MRDMFRNPKLLKIAAVVFFLASLFVGWLGFSSIPETPVSVPVIQKEKEVFYGWEFDRDLSENAVVSSSDFKRAEFESLNSLDVTDLSTLNGYKLKFAVSKGTRLTRDLLTETRPIIDELPAGFRAVAVKANEVFTVGGHLAPGDMVDIMYLQMSGRETGRISTARRLAESIRVLAVGKQLTSDHSEDDEDSRSVTARSVVLQVHESLASSIMLAESTGELRLAVVGNKDLSPQYTLPSTMTAQASFDDQGEKELNLIKSVPQVQNSLPVGISHDDYLVNLNKLGTSQLDNSRKSLKVNHKPKRRAGNYIELINGNERKVVRTNN